MNYRLSASGRPLAAITVLFAAACSSPAKSLEEARNAEAEQGRSEALRMLEDLVKRWPESPEASTAKVEIGRLHFDEGLQAVSSGDLGRAESEFRASIASYGLDSDGAHKADVALTIVVRTTASPMKDPNEVLHLYEGAPSEFQAHLSSWACDNLVAEEVASFSDCFTVSTSPSVDYSAEPPKGREVPDLSEVGERFDAMEQACTRAEQFIGTVCGDTRLAEFHAQTDPRREEFRRGVEENSEQWRAEFGAGWKTRAIASNHPG